MQKKNTPSSTISKIIYKYGDSSVPPPYHRSYKITVSPEEIEAVVDSYGEILAEKKLAISSEQFQNILAALKTHNIQECEKEEEDDEGCTGGTSESISCYDSDGNQNFHGSVYHCGGGHYGSLCGEAKAFASVLKEMIPDFNKMLD